MSRIVDCVLMDLNDIRRSTEVASTLMSRHPSSDMGNNQAITVVVMEENNLLRIRKLIPSECFKLMGFDYADADKLSAAGISNTQLYKMAGNSIVVDVLEAIFKEVYKDVDF